MSININGAGTKATTNTTVAASANKANNSTSVNNTEAAKTTDSDKAAIFEKSDSKVNYKPDTAAMEKMKADVLSQTERLRNLVSKLFSKQGETWNKAFDFLVEIDEQTRAEAKEMVSEDGYFGVQKTTERIMDFAKAISGGDPSKIELLKGAVLQGFKNAEEIWGDKMPEITQKTYDAVMAEFDKWSNEANGVSE